VTTRTTSTNARPNSAAKAPKRPRGAARRELLLEAVLTIVGEVGADAVTHRRVAEVAQLPLASTTYWFDSKDDLLTAALELAAERDVARLRELTQELCDVDPVTGAAAVDAAVTAVVDPLDEQTSRASLMATYALLLEAARRPSLQELARRWTDAYLETIGTLLHRAGSHDPRGDARLLLAAADGLLLEQLASGEDEDPRPALRRLTTALLS
jgi:TetR/AcrR family transcriptional regulator, regulator of biofilm formation and stress response